MSNEQIVSHEIAKVLKEFNFNYPCTTYYIPDGTLCNVSPMTSKFYTVSNNKISKHFPLLDYLKGDYNGRMKSLCTAPYKSEVIRWFEEHQIIRYTRTIDNKIEIYHYHKLVESFDYIDNNFVTDVNIFYDVLINKFLKIINNK